MENISLEKLKARLLYNPETGDFIWREYFGAKKPGHIAGFTHPNGYRYIQLSPFRQYRAHRLAWFYVTGQWPTKQIDHINRTKTDNRFCNLREATSSQQQANTKVSNRNKLRIRGVRIHKGAYEANIWIDGKSKYLGRFKTLAEAESVYETAAQKQFGSFYTPHVPPHSPSLTLPLLGGG